ARQASAHRPQPTQRRDARIQVLRHPSGQPPADVGAQERRYAHVGQRRRAEVGRSDHGPGPQTQAREQSLGHPRSQGGDHHQGDPDSMRRSFNMGAAVMAAIMMVATARPAWAAPPPASPRIVPPRTTTPGTTAGNTELTGDETGALGFNSCRKQPRGAKFRITLPEESELKDLVNWMMSVSCQKFIWDPKVRGSKVTILSPEPVTIEEAYAAFYAALQTMGLTVEPSGEYFKIVE